MVLLKKNFDQISQELRITSPEDMSFKYVVGAYATTAKLTELMALPILGCRVLPTIRGRKMQIMPTWILKAIKNPGLSPHLAMLHTTLMTHGKYSVALA